MNLTKTTKKRFLSDVRGFCFDSFSFCYKKIIYVVVAVDLLLVVVVALAVTEVLVVAAASAAVAVAVVVHAPILIRFEAAAGM